MSEYKIVESIYAHELEAKVNRLLAEGWKLAGSMVTSSAGFSQSLVRDVRSADSDSTLPEPHTLGWGWR